MKTHYLLGEVARLLKIKPYRISYAISMGLIPDAKLRISNKRVFTFEEIEKMAVHFGIELKKKPVRAKP
jgi:DNA-binding transcriptional MerR regulator